MRPDPTKPTQSRNRPLPGPFPFVTPRAMGWMRHIACHGPQSSIYLHAQSRHTHRSKDTSLRQLQKLREAGLLHLPAQQEATMHARFNPNIYDLTPEGRELLFEAEGDVKFVRPSGHWVHSYMTACATSSIEITARRHGVDFLPAHRILGSAKQDLSISVPTAKGTEHLIPDQLFALDYGGHYRVCALEVDRRTEPVQSTASRKSLARSVAQYAQILDRKSYRAAYGIKSNLIVLWVFASKRSETTFLELLAKRGGPVEQATLTQTVDGFYQHWSPPPLWKHLVTSPWNRAKSSPVRIDRTG